MAVNTALLVSPLGTRSPLTTPVLILVSDHVTATLAIKLLLASRLIA